MAKTVPVGYVDFVLNITRAGDADPYAVTFGGKVDTPPFTQSDLFDVALAAIAEPGELLLSGDSFSGITAYVANDGAPFIYFEPLDFAGDWTGNPLPSNCAVIMSKNTGLGGRWNKGRLFWPSISEQQVDGNGIITPQIRDAYKARWDAFLENVTDSVSGANLSELSIFHDESLDMAPTPITSFSAEAKIGTQRRRMRR